MKKYNTEFKSMIVELYKKGRLVKDLSREYGVSEVTIYKWIKQISPIASVEDTEITLEDIKRMKQEMLRLQEENEILKKAMTIFARKEVNLNYVSLSISIVQNMMLSNFVRF